ncbi:excitatory amino acid transporter-like [Ostrea edulis]|uniref:excitatory amino acid transporter-like n=1 Tax=Ostrea edulis TaxID=37623 RepID=UPI0024AEFE07|nr:excitatory amino acid transporter-like [Ostrea edulis]XP_048768894.2 excitatory amino acid transporter-like [Ostrea edulis]XP_048768896.2 excitatory amino acid transporter-like [Ostrea edulis]XP_048768898.2 excitatory amino acid transporter-like [Ostrea edulis]XP_048768899.2 excitatory amino acid transporter-like [Ostrea edulis]XP_048768902.2 excitatory amino acid transporter-like [Ostrea edulis]XP_048768903.2 excitatory amino acid transporter-like [Ostrea edulis]XP_056016563.1 excitatory
MSDVEQTSPMVEKDKEQVPDGAGSTPNDGKKGRFNRLKRVKVGKNLKSCHSWGKENLLLVLTIGGVFAGIVLGIGLRAAEPSKEAIRLIAFPGDILMRMLKMMILPLIVSCMITGLTSMDVHSSGKMGLRGVVYYFVTTFFAIILGIILVTAIHPGDKSNMPEEDEDAEKLGDDRVSSLDAFLDLIRNIFPDNIIQSGFQHIRTTYSDKTAKKKIYINVMKQDAEDLNLTDRVNMSLGLALSAKWQELVRMNKSHMFNSTSLYYKEPYQYTFQEQSLNNGINVLGIIGFFTAFGMLLSRMGEKGKLMIEFFSILNHIIMEMVTIIMWYSPVGIMFLVCGKILDIEDPSEMMQRLGMYMLTVILGLFIHAFLTLSLVYFFTTRKNPFIILRGVLQALVTAFGTGSSSATLPVTFRCLEETLHIDSRVTRFILPIGATINMDGTALYEAVGPIFIAQMNDITLSFGQIVVVSVTATCASIGAASIPSAGLITMLMVLTSVGLPTNDISLLLAVDWFLDRIRTAINVLGDSYGAAIVAHLSKEELMGPGTHPGDQELDVIEEEPEKSNGGANV